MGCVVLVLTHCATCALTAEDKMANGKKEELATSSEGQDARKVIYIHIYT